MLPFFHQDMVTFGQVPIHLFGLLSGTAVMVGHALAVRRCKQVGLDAAFAENLGWVVIILGIAISHWYSVLLYYPRDVLADPLLLLRIWDRMSSFGGLLGAFIAFQLYFRWRKPAADLNEKWRYIDAFAFQFPVAWFIGRLGCTVAVDHPGVLTHFPLGISLESPLAQEFMTQVYTASGMSLAVPPPGGWAGFGFHNLGLYEALYIALVIIPAFHFLDRKSRPAGFFAMSLALIYTPFRFAVDFLRLGEVHYGPFTVGQLTALVLFAVGCVGYYRLRKHTAVATPEPVAG